MPQKLNITHTLERACALKDFLRDPRDHDSVVVSCPSMAQARALRHILQNDNNTNLKSLTIIVNTDPYRVSGRDYDYIGDIMNIIALGLENNSHITQLTISSGSNTERVLMNFLTSLPTTKISSFSFGDSINNLDLALSLLKNARQLKHLEFFDFLDLSSLGVPGPSINQCLIALPQLEMIEITNSPSLSNQAEQLRGGFIQCETKISPIIIHGHNNEGLLYTGILLVEKSIQKIREMCGDALARYENRTDSAAAAVNQKEEEIAGAAVSSLPQAVIEIEQMPLPSEETISLIAESATAE